jgi:hypothetical protein
MPDGTWVVSAIASLAHALQIPELHAVKCLRESGIHVLVSGKGIFMFSKMYLLRSSSCLALSLHLEKAGGIFALQQ